MVTAVTSPAPDDTLCQVVTAVGRLNSSLSESLTNTQVEPKLELQHAKWPDIELCNLGLGD